MKEKYVLAIAIVLSTIIYVFGNRYVPMETDSTGISFDRFTGNGKRYFVSNSKE